MNRRRPLGIVIVALLMVAFGLAEVGTGFSHRFFGLHTAQGIVAACAGAAIGALYALGGVFIFTMRRRAAMFAIVLLGVVVAGRIAMVVTGLYPLDSFKQGIAIILGTSIAAGFAVYIALNVAVFR
jgi:hypothetical protein